MRMHVLVVVLASTGCGFLAGVDFFGVDRASDDVVPDAASPADGAARDADVDAPTPDADAGRMPRIYVLGGTSDDLALPPEARTFYADVLPDGALGAWQAGPDLPTARMYAPAFAGDDFIAMAGGSGAQAGGLANFVIGATPVTQFAESKETFAPPRSRAGVARIGQRVFVIGGQGLGGSAVLTSIETGVLGPIGLPTSGPGMFKAARPLPSPLARMAIAQEGDDIYVVGGDDGTMRQTAIRRTRLLGDDLAPFETVGALPKGRTYAQAVVYDHALVVVGGEGSVAPEISSEALTYRIPNEANAYVAGTTLPQPVSRHQLVRIGSRLYVIGGRSAAGVTGACFVGELGPGSVVSSWRPVSTLPIPLQFHAAVAL